MMPRRVRLAVLLAALAVARELLELYAARELAPGFAFSGDTPWQNELEASFPYLETEDQLRAIRAVKADMQKPQPMDRLICGDVGFGKTEVAIRAAFKAVMDGKQVAVLAPTTVLAPASADFIARLVQGRWRCSSRSGRSSTIACRAPPIRFLPSPTSTWTKWTNSSRSGKPMRARSRRFLSRSGPKAASRFNSSTKKEKRGPGPDRE